MAGYPAQTEEEHGSWPILWFDDLASGGAVERPWLRVGVPAGWAVVAPKRYLHQLCSIQQFYYCMSPQYSFYYIIIQIEL